MSTSITLTTGQLLAAVPALQSLLAVKMPAASAWTLAKVARDLDDHLSAFNKAREKLAVDFKDDGEALNRETNVLLKQEVTVETTKIKVSDLGSADIEPGTLLNVHWLLEN